MLSQNHFWLTSNTLKNQHTVSINDVSTEAVSPHPARALRSVVSEQIDPGCYGGVKMWTLFSKFFFCLFITVAKNLKQIKISD